MKTTAKMTTTTIIIAAHMYKPPLLFFRRFIQSGHYFYCTLKQLASKKFLLPHFGRNVKNPHRDYHHGFFGNNPFMKST
jgi:hypothetical protein